MIWWKGFLAFAMGTILGSFLNVVIVRLPKSRSIVRPGSHCPSCGHPIPFYDNIPLLSYLWLRGRCRFCKASISFLYPTVESLTGLFLLALFVRFGFGLEFFSRLMLVLFLIPITFIDLSDQIIPDCLSLTGAITGFAIALIPGGLPWTASLGAAGAGAATMALVAFLGRALFREEAMGWGDVKLAGMIGSYMGWTQLLVALFLSFLIGALAGLALTGLGRKSMRSRIPFGPFMATGSLIAIFYGRPLLEWYLGLLSR